MVATVYTMYDICTKYMYGFQIMYMYTYTRTCTVHVHILHVHVRVDNGSIMCINLRPLYIAKAILSICANQIL